MYGYIYLFSCTTYGRACNYASTMQMLIALLGSWGQFDGIYCDIYMNIYLMQYIFYGIYSYLIYMNIYLMQYILIPIYKYIYLMEYVLIYVNIY